MEKDEAIGDDTEPLFFNKRVPKNYQLKELPDEMKNFMNTYRNKDRAELMKFLGDKKYNLPQELIDAYSTLNGGPSIVSDHIYNACLPIKWRDEFMSTEKLISNFFKKHSNLR